MCTGDAPASNASWVDSICSAGVTGTAGLSFFLGTAPVMATVMMTGVLLKRLLQALPSACNDAPMPSRERQLTCGDLVLRAELT
jgi:hypothetical protein